jgi:hypothetical protein
MQATLSAADLVVPEEPPTVPVLRLLVVALVILNLLDAVFTLTWVQLGVATEANVLLSHVLDASAVAFMLVKLGLVSLGVELLWRHRHRRLAVIGLVVCFVAYNALLLYHLQIAALTVKMA